MLSSPRLNSQQIRKGFPKKTIKEWYAKEIHRQLDAGIPFEEADVKLRRSVMKPIHAHWMIELYNHMTTRKGKKNIMSGWRAAGTHDAVCKVRIKKITNNFSDLDPILDDSISDGQNLNVLCDMSEDKIAAGYSRIENENDIDSDDEWEMSRGAFDAIQEMQDEFND